MYNPRDTRNITFVPNTKPTRQGKVRDTYTLTDGVNNQHKMLVVATDRISIFDFVLGDIIPQKGEILNALNIFWRKNIMTEFPGIKQDIRGWITSLDRYLPAELANNPDLHKRATVVEMIDMLPIEAIIRNFLTGTAFHVYKSLGKVCGHVLPQGLLDGSELPSPIFTPSTKAEVGHDEHLTAEEVAEKFGYKPEQQSLQLFLYAKALCAKRGLILVDTKFEFGKRRDMVDLVLADEILTPDSSRFWLASDYDPKNSKIPPSLDKQFVREWGKSIGIDKRDPKNPADVLWVQEQKIPNDIIERTHQIYRYVFFKLTGFTLEQFQEKVMGLGKITHPKRNIHVVFGSRSDITQAREGLDYLQHRHKEGKIDLHVNIISCHRNPGELQNYAMSLRQKNTIVIAGAGLAAALPGVLQAWLSACGKEHIPVLGVAFEGRTTEETLAAKYSIEHLPGRPVQLDDNHNAYLGSSGFKRAAIGATHNEFLCKPREPKSAEIDIKI
jgi:phosphoribosylaminoimidazole-succinocarboxamide synthase